jgi:hypothetical protein
MPLFLKVTDTGDVVGNYRGKEAPTQEGYIFVEVSEEIGQSVQGFNHAKDGPLRWRWDGGKVVEIPDPRFPVRVTQTPNPGLVGQSLAITLEVLNDLGNIRTGLNRDDVTILYRDQEGRRRRARLSIVGGVASKELTPTTSGEIELQSDRTQVRFIGDNPVVIDEAW